MSGGVTRCHPGCSDEWAILGNWRQRTTTSTADPTKPNQNGAVIPYSRASRPPIGVPTTIPANAATVYTPVTLPSRASGTARWRTTVDVVPHTKACAPNTTNVASAIAADVVSARTRCVAVSIRRPTRMMSPSENRRSRRPYEVVPMIPPTAMAVVSRPKPTARHAEPVLRVQDEHGPRRAEGDVEQEDREGEGPHRRVGEEPAETLGHVRADACPRRRRRRLSLRRAAAGRSARRAAHQGRSTPRWSRRAAPCRGRTGRHPPAA